MFGGNGGFSQPGTREVVHRTEAQEIQADDARGLRVIILNVVMVCLAIVSIVILGPVIGYVLPVFIIVYAMFFSGAPDNVQGGRLDFKTTLWCGGVIACMLWIFALGAGLWGWWVEWYPFHATLPWWALLITWAIIGAVFSGVWDTRKSHYKSLWNRNWPPTYSQMRPEVGPYYEGGEGGSVDALSNEAEQRALKMLENLAQQIQPQYVDRLALVNGNGNQEQSPIAPFDSARLVRANGGRQVRLADVETFCKSLDTAGPTCEAWPRWDEKYWHSVVVYTASLGITTVPKKKTKTRAFMSSEDALAKLYSLYPKSEAHSPTLIEGGQTTPANEDSGR